MNTSAEIAEEIASRKLSAVLADVAVGEELPDSATFREALAALAYALPELFAKTRLSRRRGLDNIDSAQARRTGERNLEVVGLCRYASGQTLVPFRIDLELVAEVDAIARFDFRVGSQLDAPALFAHPPTPRRSEPAPKWNAMQVV